MELSDFSENAKKIAEAVSVASSCDAAMVVVGGNQVTCREGWVGRRGDRADLNLLGQQDDLVRAILSTGKPTIVVLIHGRPNSIGYIAEHVPAIVEGWYLGQETGSAIADVLFGDVNPGGKLPISIPRSVGHLPVYYNKKPSLGENKDIYQFTENTPLFPFGHGLSYTRFDYDSLQVSPSVIKNGEHARVSVDVTNIGDWRGDEVVQLYIRDVISSVTRPLKELKGFERITLEVGETRNVTFDILPKHLAFWNEEMVVAVESGEIELWVGTSSTDCRMVKLVVE